MDSIKIADLIDVEAIQKDRERLKAYTDSLAIELEATAKLMKEFENLQKVMGQLSESLKRIVILSKIIKPTTAERVQDLIDRSKL